MGTTKAQKVFDIAMGLMDEVNESTGQTDTSDTKEYKQRTLLILTALRGELYPYSDTLEEAEPGKRPVCQPIADFETPVDLDDVLAQTVMPYGLAAQLLLDENPSAASFLQQRYEELIRALARSLSTVAEDIENLYGGIEYGQFSRW